MSGCRETLDNMNFCWDAKTFDTAMLMFPDHPVYSWILLNENAVNVKGMRQAENWTSMDDVCAGVRNDFEIEQEGIYLTLSSLHADQFSCVQGYEFGALYPLAKYMSEKGAFGRELQPPDAAQNPEFDKQIEDKSAQLSAKEGELAQKEALLNETNNAELKQYVQNDIDVLNTDISTLRDELADLESKAAPAIDEDNALAIVAQSIREYFTTRFAADNEGLNNAKNGFSMGAMVLIRGFAPYSRPAIGDETGPLWLPNGVFDKAIERAVEDGAINTHEGNLYRAFKRINNGMTSLEIARKTNMLFAQNNMKEATELFQQVNPNMLGVAMRQVYTEVKATFDPATAQTVEPKKIAKKEETKKDEKKKDEKKKDDSGFDCDTKPQVYLFWSKDKKDAFKANCRK